MGKLINILGAFVNDPEWLDAVPFGEGLINLTYKVLDADKNNAFILQQLNTTIFTRPDIVAQNILHAGERISIKDPSYRCLHLQKTIGGELYHIDDCGHYWRLFDYIQQTTTLAKIDSPDKAYLTAFEFGRFTQLLANNDTHRFKPSIPNFHDLTIRFQQFEKTVAECTGQRKESSQKLISYLMSQKHLVGVYQSIVSRKIIPLRIQHCDTKISNILFDETTHKPVCVIDWDTLMPAYFISDLGDMIRTMVCSSDENDKEQEAMMFRDSYYNAVVSGYTEALSLTSAEKELIPYAGKFMTYMQALRFLTDFLQEDKYYAISYETQNLDRAANQCRLLALLEENIKQQ